jgi:hypothetical protein
MEEVKDGVVTGYFNIDLLELDRMPLTPQSYTIWAISKGVISNPVNIELTVGEE